MATTLTATFTGNIISLKGTKCSLSLALKQAPARNVRLMKDILSAFYADDVARMNNRVAKSAAKKQAGDTDLLALEETNRFDAIPAAKAAKAAYRKQGAKGFFEYFDIQLTEEAYARFDALNSAWALNTAKRYSNGESVYVRRRNFRSFCADIAVTMAAPSNGRLLSLQ